MSPRAKKATPKRGGARPGAGRPRTLEPPEGSPEIRVRLDQPSGLALLRYRQSQAIDGVETVAGGGVASALVRELLTAWGDSAEVRKAVEAWRKERGA